MIKLYPFQKKIAEAIAKKMRHKDTVIITIPSGFGKAYIMKEVARLLYEPMRQYKIRKTRQAKRATKNRKAKG